jgi:hypothetical protein
MPSMTTSDESLGSGLVEGTTAQVVGGRAAREMAVSGEKCVCQVIYQVMPLVAEKCVSTTDKKEGLLLCLARSIIVHNMCIILRKNTS